MTVHQHVFLVSAWDTVAPERMGNCATAVNSVLCQTISQPYKPLRWHHEQNMQCLSMLTYSLTPICIHFSFDSSMSLRMWLYMCSLWNTVSERVAAVSDLLTARKMQGPWVLCKRRFAVYSTVYTSASAGSVAYVYVKQLLYSIRALL